MLEITDSIVKARKEFQALDSKAVKAIASLDRFWRDILCKYPIAVLYWVAAGICCVDKAGNDCAVSTKSIDKLKLTTPSGSWLKVAYFRANACYAIPEVLIRSANTPTQILAEIARMNRLIERAELEGERVPCTWDINVPCKCTLNHPEIAELQARDERKETRVKTQSATKGAMQKTEAELLQFIQANTRDNPLYATLLGDFVSAYRKAWLKHKASEAPEAPEAPEAQVA